MKDFYKNKQTMQNSLSMIIKQHRFRKNKSITLLSNEIGITKSLWSVLEKGEKDPQLSTLWRVCEALDIPLSSVILELENDLGDEFFLSE